MVRTPPKDSSKLSRNAEKLSSCEAAYMNVKNELVARMTALLHEKWDFANAPLLQRNILTVTLADNAAAARGEPLAARQNSCCVPYGALP